MRNATRPTTGPISRARILVLAAAIAPALLLTGCAGQRQNVVEIDPPVMYDARALGPAIDVEVFRGDVTIRVDPNAERIRVERRFDVGTGIDSETRRAIVEHTDFSVETVDQDDLPVVRVLAVTPHPEVAQHRMDVRIVAPSVGGVRVRTGGGRIVMVNVEGGVHAETGEGPIELRTMRPLRDPVALTTGKGNIWLQAPFASRGAIDVDAGAGRAVLESTNPRVRVENPPAVGARYTCTINGGENPVLLRTGDGVAFIGILADPVGRVRIVR